MPRQHALRRLPKIIFRLALRVVVAGFLIVATILLVAAFADRKLPDLRAWHEGEPKDEFRAGDADDGYDFDDYLAQEARVFEQLEAFHVAAKDAGRSKLLRYLKGGPNDPDTFDRNWNRTFELRPEGEPRGSVLMLHGLSDSPYSMRSAADVYHREGFYVLGLRMPGHGTVPAGLLSVRWEDWVAAVRLAAPYARQQAPEKPFHLCGYSNGGAVAVIYTLQSLEETDLPRPDRLFLFSPAIGITRLAAASNWHKLYSWMPYFEKSKWLGIQPEYDPFKYNSFPKNAGAQSWQVARAIQAELKRAHQDGRLGQMPPIFTFQSIADSTIIAHAVVDRLYDRLGANGSRLVVFDVNCAAVLDEFYRADVHAQAERMLEGDPRQYDVVVVQNAGPTTLSVVTRSRSAQATEVVEQPLDGAWPVGVYSLAHVAIPFPPDDPLYGEHTGDNPGHEWIGDWALRGEKDVLQVAAADLLRLRHNPFHELMMQGIAKVIETDPSPGAD